MSLMQRMRCTPRWAEVQALTDDEVLALEFDFEWWGMPHQFVPKNAANKVLWFGGRGAAKTVAMAHAMRADVERGAMHLAIVGRTSEDIRVFIEGPSGLIAAFPPHHRPRYLVSKKKVVFHTGAEAFCISMEVGPEVAFKGKGFEVGVLSEISTYGDDLAEVWKQVLINARIGNPRIYADANPLPDNRFLRDLIARADDLGITVIPCSSYDNFNNLPDETRAYLEELAKTSLGRSEVFPEFLSFDGALWNKNWIRVRPAPDHGTTVIAVDPAGTFNRNSDEHGIICARSAVDPNGRRIGYVLADASFKGAVTEWPLKVAELARKFNAGRVVIERNRGLDYLKAAIKPHLPHIDLDEITVTRSKDDRAIPVAQLYELERVFHDHHFERLEEQMTTWIPASQETARKRGEATSPDRLDALVHAITALRLDVAPAVFSGIKQPPRRTR